MKTSEMDQEEIQDEIGSIAHKMIGAVMRKHGAVKEFDLWNGLRGELIFKPNESANRMESTVALELVCIIVDCLLRDKANGEFYEELRKAAIEESKKQSFNIDFIRRLDSQDVEWEVSDSLLCYDRWDLDAKIKAFEYLRVFVSKFEPRGLDHTILIHDIDVILHALRFLQENDPKEAKKAKKLLKTA